MTEKEYRRTIGCLLMSVLLGLMGISGFILLLYALGVNI